MKVAVVCGNPKPKSRTLDAALFVAERLSGAPPEAMLRGPGAPGRTRSSGQRRPRHYLRISRRTTIWVSAKPPLPLETFAMLSKENTETLCRVGPGTVMGDLMRQYWLPCVYSWELTADGDPLRVRMLGEDLIAFRDSNGTPGFIANNCPHRGASLFFGRNEEAGLRCVYHGWKFDVDGNCLDMPNEPAESDFKARVKAQTYPAQEYAGL